MYLSKLTIPGTHGKWPFIFYVQVEGRKAWYVSLTLPTRQYTLFCGKRKTEAPEAHHVSQADL